MSFLSGLNRLKAKQTKPGLFRTMPVRKPLLVNPDNAPRTMTRYPEGFRDFKFVGATVEQITQDAMRRPALVALLKRIARLPSGVVVEEEMTASVADLRAYKDPSGKPHAEAEKAALRLREYYETKVPAEQQEASRLQAAAPKNSLYAKLNGVMPDSRTGAAAAL